MKKYISILGAVALLVACEQKTETVAPPASPATTPEATETAAEPAASAVESPEDADSDMSTPALPTESTPPSDLSGSWIPTPTPTP